MNLYDIILESAKAALALQKTDGSFTPGWNGPYHDPETPVRNTSHWLITLLKAYEISKKTVFKNAAYRASEYLCSKDACPMGASFYCRTNPEKDFCNGLIGQAWTIEALIIAGQIFENKKYIELAKKKVHIHPFDFDIGLWRRVNVDGSYLGFDMTFNHQLWFAAVASMVDSDSEKIIGKKVCRFLDRAAESHLQIARSGRIIHPIITSFGFKKLIKFIFSMRRPSHMFQEKSNMGYKEIGYHAFNLYAFAILKQQFPKHEIWKSDKFLSLLNFINKQKFIAELNKNKFGYPYNPPGFEVAFSIQVFESSMSSVLKPAKWWVNQQLQRCYDIKIKMLNRNTEDPETMAARIYEATRLDDMEINNIE